MARISDHLLFLIFTFFITLQLLQLFYGATGVSKQQLLDQQMLQLSDNLSSMQNYQDHLRNSLSKIANNGSYIVTQARDLGYYGLKENLILVNTWLKESRSPQPGRLVPIDATPATSEKPLVLAALLIALGLSIVHGYLPQKRHSG